MKQLLDSTFVVFCMLVLVVMGGINTFQINNLEKSMIANHEAIEGLRDGGVSVARVGASATKAQSSVDAYRQIEKEALADANNLLVGNPKGVAQGRDIVRNGTLRMQFGSDPRGMNPYIANGADVSELERYMSNQLATPQLDDPGVYSPELAVKITSPDDGLTYEIELRKDVYWHRPKVDWKSGRYDWLKGDHKLTSDDFKFIFDMLANPQVAGRISSLRTYFEALDRVEVIDDHHFKIIFKERLYMNFVSVATITPLPRWLYMYDEDGNKFDDATWGKKLNEHWYNQKMIGTGPYQFSAWDPGVRIEMERNERYWGEPASFEGIQIFITKDQNAWPRKLKTGEFDFTHLQPEQYRTEIMEKKGPVFGKQDLRKTEHPELGYFYVGWNHDSPYFNDKKVRQAMTMALNRRDVIDNVFVGLGVPTSGPFPTDNPCYDKSIEPWPFDLKLAAAKLEEAGWKDTDGDGIRDKEIDGEKVAFEFSMMVYGSSSEYQTLANIFREDLLQIGVKLNPRALEWSTMLKKMDERDFDAYTGGWALGWETDLMQIWHSKEADKAKSSNRIGFRNKEADRIAETLRTKFKEEERVKLCHEFHNLVHEEQPYSFIYQRRRSVVFWEHLNELVFSKIYPQRDLRHFSFNQLRP